VNEKSIDTRGSRRSFSSVFRESSLASILFSRRDRKTIEARRDPGSRSSVSGSFSSPPSPLSRWACDLAITWLDHESWNPLSRGGDSSDRVPLFLLLSLLSRVPCFTTFLLRESIDFVLRKSFILLRE